MIGETIGFGGQNAPVDGKPRGSLPRPNPERHQLSLASKAWLQGDPSLQHEYGSGVSAPNFEETSFEEGGCGWMVKA
jgi:hypothetical protein